MKKNLFTRINAIFIIILFLIAASSYAYYQITITRLSQQHSTTILGKDDFYSASPASLRVIVSDLQGRPYKDATVSYFLAGKQSKWELGEFTTDSSGSARGQFMIPEIEPGNYELTIETESAHGSDRISQEVKVHAPALPYLSTDRPVYQPGQTIHYRVMALNRMTNRPMQAEEVTVELRDPKDNVIHRSTLHTSTYGISSDSLEIADIVNEGIYTLRATIGNEAHEIPLRVEHYTLPAFKMLVDTDKPFYKPGETVTLDVNANYYYGKPVADAAVKVTITDENDRLVWNSNTQLDDQGRVTLEYQTPQEKTYDQVKHLTVRTEITDALERTVKDTQTVPVSSSAIQLTVTPECGTLIPGLPNRVYVLASYPDGTPAQCDITHKGKTYQTDKEGVVVLELYPSPGKTPILRVDAQDANGRTSTLSRELELEPQEQKHFHVRTDRAAYLSGDEVRVSILSKTSQTFMLDLLQNDQVVYSTAITNSDGEEFAFNIPDGLTGELTLNTYYHTQSGLTYLRSNRLIVVPDNQLNITTSTDKESYRPGEEAQLTFKVTDNKGAPVTTALGVSIIDEAIEGIAGERATLKTWAASKAGILAQRFSPKWLLADSSQNYLLAQIPDKKEPATPAALMAILDEYYGPGQFERMVQEYGREAMLESIDSMQGMFDENTERLMRELLTQQGDFSLNVNTAHLKRAELERFERRFQARTQNLLPALFFLFLGVFLLELYVWQAFNKTNLSVSKLQNDNEKQAGYYSRMLMHCSEFMILFPLLLFTMIHLSISEIIGGSVSKNLNIVVVVEVVITTGLFGYMLCCYREIKKHVKFHDDSPLIFLLCVSAYAALFYASRWAIVFDRLRELHLLATVLGTIILCGIASLIAHGIAKDFKCGKDRGPSKLTEVLLILCIIGVLAGILIPAVGSVREAATQSRMMSDVRQLGNALMTAQITGNGISLEGTITSQPQNEQPVHIRRNFPDTLNWTPQLITDESGKATVSVDLADSITNWKVYAESVSESGYLGETKADIMVFQPVFVSMQLPQRLTTGDKITLPVSVKNYSSNEQEFSLKADASGIPCELTLNDNSISVPAGDEGIVYLTLNPQAHGTLSILFEATGEHGQDAIEKQLDVLPEGILKSWALNGQLTTEAIETLSLPENMLDSSSEVYLKLYPSKIAEAIDGVDELLRKPYGCFEQTSSTTYPNALILAHLQQQQQPDKQTVEKAETYLKLGYQRLLTFEVSGGGFSLYGRSPAREHLTAYGILEFSDISKSITIDHSVIERATNWLISRQNTDGSWLNQNLKMTAYITWALSESGVGNKASLAKAELFLEKNADRADSNYTRAMIANVLLSNSSSNRVGNQLLDQLLNQTRRAPEKELNYIPGTGQGIYYSRGHALDVETTALTLLAIDSSRRHESIEPKLFEWLRLQKQPYQGWGSTQATILAIKALLHEGSPTGKREQDMLLTVLHDSESIYEQEIPTENSDLVYTLNLGNIAHEGLNELTLRSSNQEPLSYQLYGSYWVSNTLPNHGESSESPLQLEVTYPEQIKIGEPEKLSVELSNTSKLQVKLPLIEIPIPAGFRVDTDTLARLKRLGTIEHYTTTPSECALYLDEVDSGETIHIELDISAIYPGEITAPQSRVFEFYTPDNQTRSQLQRVKIVE